ncbi:transposase, partial [Ensifer sp. LC54]|uniref:transposase n=1 Tax=Ensifer sp. LC54 TaxID=1873715 RepID=UPI00081301FC
PKDHLLRKIDAVIDFSFIHDRVAGLYCADNGRPPLDPTLMFKALFIGYLFGIRSERQLVREIEVNVAYRWFLRMKLTDGVFDASTLSQNRRRRFNDTSVAQDIFDHIVEQAIGHGLVDGTVLYTDSTHLKANANKGKYDLHMIAKSRSDYWADHLDHRTVDGRHAIITDTFTTPANVHDSVVYLDRLDRQRQRFSFDVKAVGLDAGYATSGIAKGLEQRDILGVTGYRNPTPPKPGMMRKSTFAYDGEVDGYRCPQGQLLTYATTDRNGYRHYRSDPALCHDCPLLASCTANAKDERTITRHVWQDARERTDAHRKTPWGKAIYKRRKETVERSFADAKQLHGHRYARFRSLTRVACQCLLAAAAQNIKKIAMALTRG